MRKMKMVIAALCAVTMLCSCTQGGKNGEEKSAVKSVKWILPCATQEDNNLVYDEVNKLIQPKLGFEVEFMAVDFGSYQEKMQIINAAQDQYDICYTSNWLNNYYQNIEQGNLLDISESLPKYAPETYNQIKKEFWDGIKVDGKLYGVINQQIMAREPFITMPKAYVEKYGIDPAQVKTIEDLENIAKMVIADDPECNGSGIAWDDYIQILGYEYISNNLPAAVKIDSEGIPQVVNIYKTQDYKDYLQLMKKWVDMGIKKANLVAETDAVEQYKNDKIAYVFGLGATYKPGVEQEILANTKVEPVAIHFTEPLLTTGGVASTLSSVSVTTVDEEAALKAINIVNSDKEVYNMLSFGIEGRHYTKIDENRIELSADNRYITANWAIGNVFNSYLYGDQADNVWEETAKINNEARISPIYGFVPDFLPINLQISNCTTVCDEFLDTLNAGIGDVDANYAEFIEKLDAAGAQAIVDELQNQINEWYAANKQ